MRRWRKRLRRLLVAATVLFLASLAGFTILDRLAPFPEELLAGLPSSARVVDRHGELVLERLGGDEQWRHPLPLEELGAWLPLATVAVEDQRFEEHGGVDWLAALRAAGQNLVGGRVVSGASTLTMQTCRMLEPRPRTFEAKAVETFRALQLDELRSKREILELYLNLAPYGGNLRGAEAAARQWFGKVARDLTLAEAALLAGLPQSPERLRPDRDPEAARARRDFVLRRMEETGVIDRDESMWARAQPIVLRPHARAAMPTGAHAAWWALQRRPEGGRLGLELALQRQVEELAFEHARALPDGADLAVVVIDVDQARLRAFLGSADPEDPIDGQVDGARARRSPGSLLKPFVVAAAFEDRRLSPGDTLPDRSLLRAGWDPRNLDRKLRGSVTVEEALQDSLNLPLLHLAERIGIERAARTLRAVGLPLSEPELERAGLALVTGAVEMRLVDLTNAWAALARGGAWRPARLYLDEPAPTRRALPPEVCAALDRILDTTRRAPRGFETARPDDLGWFTWKTGTSSGHRDAWAVGHNGRHAIGVWVGHFSGQGDPEFLGADAAEPLLARLFQLDALRVPGPRWSPAVLDWQVESPLFEGRAETPLKILSPEPGAVFYARAGASRVPLRTNRPDAQDGLHWFLGSRPLPSREVDDLRLGPGRYELRCVAPSGTTVRSSFEVR